MNTRTATGYKKFPEIGLHIALVFLSNCAITLNVGAADGIRFERDIWPILDAHCIRCHGAAEAEGALRLDTPQGLAEGGEYGAVVDLDKPHESSLLELISLPADDPDRMPSKGDPLSSAQIDLIRTWLVAGASTEGWTQQLADEANARAKAYHEKKAATPVVLPATFKPSIAEISFNKHIRPILSNACFACHGPDSAARKADLRLDVEEDAKAPRDGGAAIVPGEARASSLVSRVFHHDPEEAMPPEESGKMLTDDDRHLLAAWIEQGADYEPLWSYMAPRRPQVAHDTGDSWSQNTVDRLLQTRWKEEELVPSAQADPTTLVRRLYHDLTGLPPEPQVVDTFAAAPTPEAYAQLVSDLLASPAYGERMAINWLDQVRYADSNGYHSDEERVIFPYRDYVINAFNKNKPFDEFTTEQLAGDLLPNPTRDQLVATGFNRLNQITAEGGAQGKEYRAKYNADRVRALGSVWLGATLECAECHDHKFDPFSMKDFYQFASFFADLEEEDVYRGRSKWRPILYLPDENQQERLDGVDAEIAQFEAALTASSAKTDKAARKWSKKIKPRSKKATRGWLPLTPIEAKSDMNGTFELQPDLSLLSTGLDAPQDVHEFTYITDQECVTGIRLDALPHPSFLLNLSRYREQAQLNEIEIFASTKTSSSRIPLSIKAGALSYSRDRASLRRTFDGDFVSNWRYSGRYSDEDHRREPMAWMYEFDEPIPGGPGTTITVRLHYLGLNGDDRSAFGRVRLSATTDEQPEIDAPVGAPERIIVAKAAKMEKDAFFNMAQPYYTAVDPKRDALRDSLNKAYAKRRRIEDDLPFTLYSRALPIPRETRILARGNWQDDSGEVVAPDTPEFLPALEAANGRPTRFDLANWLVDPENPLTARVFVNRLWKLFFGRGLAADLDDFGTQGALPTHPELLDWLATEFIESGWDVKHMVRLIVSSAAYQQSSNATHEQLERDTQNTFFARQSTFRYEAEGVRDTALQLSGLLNDAIGGPSMRPYQPEGYWEHLNFPKRTWTHDDNDSQYRRGLYVHWQRSFLHPSMLAFDAPSREECTAERNRSNTPLQALTLLNDPTYVEASRAFANRILHEGGESIDDKVVWAFRQAVSRPPSNEEAAVLRDLYRNHHASYEAEPEIAQSQGEVGRYQPPEDTDPVELAAWTSVARVILNLHETITRS